MDDTLAATLPNTQTSIKEHYSNTVTQRTCLATCLGWEILHSLCPSGLGLWGAKYFWRCPWNDCHYSNVWCWLKIAAGRGCAAVNRPVIKQFPSLQRPHWATTKLPWKESTAAILKTAFKTASISVSNTVLTYFCFKVLNFFKLSICLGQNSPWFIYWSCLRNKTSNSQKFIAEDYSSVMTIGVLILVPDAWQSWETEKIGLALFQTHAGDEVRWNWTLAWKNKTWGATLVPFV